MANYTMTLQDLAMAKVWETGADLPEFKYQTLMDFYQPYLFQFDYKLFDEDPDGSLKDNFEKMIIKEFWLREIGFETENMFIVRLDAAISRYREKWNLLAMDFLPDYNLRLMQDMATVRAESSHLDETIASIQNASNRGNTTSTGTSQNRNMFSDTPDDRLSLTNASNVIQFASTLSQDDATSNTSGTSQNTANSQGTSNTVWDRTQNSKLEQTGMGINDDNEQYHEFQRWFKTLNEVIISDLQPLFMNIY